MEKHRKELQVTNAKSAPAACKLRQACLHVAARTGVGPIPTPATAIYLGMYSVHAQGISREQTRSKPFI